MNWLVILIALILLWRIAEGFHRGMVKEIVSLISLIVLSLTVVLLSSALSSYFEKDIVSMVAAIIMLLILLIAHRLLSFLFFSAKLISKLPVIKFANKLMGAVFGAAETVLLIWTMYALIIVFGLGMIGHQILAYVQENTVLTWLYQHNYLMYWAGQLSDKIGTLPNLL